MGQTALKENDPAKFLLGEKSFDRRCSMPMPLTLKEIGEILANGAFEKFLGEIESECFDAKAQPYQSDEAGKREMAKDASAFANVVGGFIVLGLKTKPSLLHLGDEVDELRPIPQTLVDPDQYTKILDTWCYPPIEGLSVRFHPSTSIASQGFIAIAVPPQRAELKPFLIVRSFDGDKKKIETMFGYAERRRDGNSPLGVSDLQKALRAGLFFEQRIEARFDRIEGMLTNPAVGPRTIPDADEMAVRLEDRIKSILGGGGEGGAGA
jgi:hypothetical protein